MATLLEHGYDAVTDTEIARAAGVHPTTVYRRWGGRPQLVAEVVHRISGQAIPPPDEGSLAADLRVLLREVADLLERARRLIAPAYLRALLTGAPLDEEFIDATARRTTRAFGADSAQP